MGSIRKDSLSPKPASGDIIKVGKKNISNSYDQVVKLREDYVLYVYLLKSVENDHLYVGSTNDLVRRVKEHNLGLSPSDQSLQTMETYIL